MAHNKRTFLTLIDVLVSAGAAVIIFAAWAKLTHQSYADMMLTIGMWTETAIFLGLNQSTMKKMMNQLT
jgi:hypothetical protein